MKLTAEQKIHRPGRLLATMVMVCGLTLVAACGKKSPLEPPPGYKPEQASEVQDSKN